MTLEFQSSEPNIAILKWLCTAFLDILNTKRLISPERGGFGAQIFYWEYILGVYIYVLP